MDKQSLPPIATLTLNPCLDVSYEFESLVSDQKVRADHTRFDAGGRGQARCKASPAPSCWPSALNPSWKATVPCGVFPSKDKAKKTSCGTPSCTSPDMFSNPNFL
jgi:hypothetical protein